MPPFNRHQAAAAAVALLVTLTGHAAPATAQQLPPAPFTTTLSNNTPLAFGMEPQDVARALGAPLSYVSGPPAAEIYLAIRHIGGSGLFPRNDPLYLQFRGGRLTGWKGDWGSRWLWQ